MLEKEVSPIALTPGTIDILVEKIREDVCRNPDANLIPYVFEFREMEKDCERNLIHTLMLNLYSQDVCSLRRDLTKFVVLGTAQVQPSQRAALLHALIGVAYLYFDCSDLLALCNQIEEAHKDSSPVLDTRG